MSERVLAFFFFFSSKLFPYSLPLILSAANQVLYTEAVSTSKSEDDYYGMDLGIFGIQERMLSSAHSRAQPVYSSVPL